jgi:hypothetical protein
VKKILLALLLGWPLLAAAQTAAKAADSPQKKVERAADRCKAQRGVDCDTPEGLHEWVLQERSRAEAVRQGSRHQTNTPSPR